MNTYASLHNHTDYSNIKLIDSINSVTSLITSAYDLGLAGVAITDHDCLSGHIKALDAAAKLNKDRPFKLVLGNEIYLTKDGLNAENMESGKDFYHLILLAKDKIGHDQLRELSSRAWGRSWMRNIMRTPTYSQDLIDVVGADPGHLICSTACLGSFSGYHFGCGNYDAIPPYLCRMAELFGQDNFYIELQPSLQPDQRNYNKFLVSNFWGKYNFICTTDSHFGSKDQAEVHKIFLNSKSGGGDREVESFYASAYLMGYEEIQDYFDADPGVTEEQFRIMCENTIKIIDQVEEYSLEHTQIVPRVEYTTTSEMRKIAEDFLKWSLQYVDRSSIENLFAMLDNDTDTYLLYLIATGLQEKAEHFDGVPNATTIHRIEYEMEQVLDISRQMGQHVSDYFITMVKNIDIVWNDGNSLVGTARGSATGFLINYLVGITQINPLTQPLEMLPWRFMHKSRPGLPDIDFDSESAKRKQIFNRIKEYFQGIGGDAINICTFGTEGSRSAIKTAGRGLELNDDTLSYVVSLIPKERGNDLTLSQCFYGDDEHNPIASFREVMEELPMLWKVAKTIEGLITRLGVHASGVLELNDPIVKYNSVLKTSKGVLVTAYNLEDSERMGGLKYDFLTIQALDKIRTCMNWLLEEEKIQWQGSLKATYNKYLHPDVLIQDDNKMWEQLHAGKMMDIFQFDTMVGSQAVKLIQPTSILELAVGNNVMRLAAQEGKELPLETYSRYKKDIGYWYDEMRANGLNQKEIEVLEKHLLSISGVADSQESVMLLVMDKDIANFDMAEANILRKGIAKKSIKAVEAAKSLYYKKGLELGTRMELLNYVWDVQIAKSLGYSFSSLHSVAYSYIALQEMNLSYLYPDLYWKTACLSVNAGAINDEDFYNLVEEGIIELSDESDKREQNKVQYGEIASAVSQFSKYISIELPDINNARFGFTPVEERNAIVFGLKGISKVGDNIVQEIILRRPYNSLMDFIEKMVQNGKKLISKDKVINLIKAGAFDKIEKSDRATILRDYIKYLVPPKTTLNLRNYQMLSTKKFLPSEFDFSTKMFNFVKYLRTMRSGNYYLLDEIAMEFYLENLDPSKLTMLKVEGDTVPAILSTTMDTIYTNVMAKPKQYIKENLDQLLTVVNQDAFQEEFNKYVKGDELQWELDSLGFFHSGHPLINTKFPALVKTAAQLIEDDYDGYWMIKGKQIPKYRLSSIAGVVLDKDAAKCLVTLSTPDGIIDLKLHKPQFARYARAISEEQKDGTKVILEDSFLNKGNYLLVTGVKKGGLFVPKTYKNTGHDAILKIKCNSDFSEAEEFIRKSE